MSDIIRLLPDSVANQIAAGEVIQRPASAVKELLENAVDAGATSIKLIVKDAGKALIQVIDNGCGMSETDARMSFERHATSKIAQTEDLFAIRTMGFRGEAMASIAAIAQVEMKTRRIGDELGTKIEVDGTKVISHEPCSTPEGTRISVKNLFYNVPARRKFLKATAVEMRHIVDEFQRVALAHPDTSFTLFHNDAEVFILEKGTFRQRIISLTGKNYNEKLVPVEEETSVLNIAGFIGKPEFAKKIRGEQYFFVNKRFIKNAYLHHAVANAFEGLLPADSHPTYFLHLTLDPSTIDINIHPTKTEIKFEDERSVYTIIRAAVKQSLGKYNITPSLDFSQDNSFEISIPKSTDEIRMPVITVNPEFNPFDSANSNGLKKSQGYTPAPGLGTPGGRADWEKLMAPLHDNIIGSEKLLQQEAAGTPEIMEGPVHTSVPTFQLHAKYILSPIKSGMMVIHQQRAHERILFEKYIISLEKNSGRSQQLLFPQTVELSPVDFMLVREIFNDIKSLGFDLGEFGNNTLVVHGMPTEAGPADAKTLLEKMLENFNNSSGNFLTGNKDKLAYSLSRIASIKEGKKMEKEEMSLLIDQLFACTNPYFSPNGKPTVVTLTLEELEKKFL